MNEIEKQVKGIVYEEFSKLIRNIEEDFEDNFKKKSNNFLLNQLDKNIIANMVFVSSFESKCGNAIEICAKKIAKLKFGHENVPTIVNPRGVASDIDPASVENKQIVVTDIDTDNPSLKGFISKFRSSRMGSGSGKKRIESSVTQSSIKELITEGQKYKSEKCHKKPVDLAFFDGENWNVLELKAGGDLDSSNAPANVEKLLMIYTGINISNAKAYFATLYNKDGEGKPWNGVVKKHLNYSEMCLIGSAFWKKILPKGITFEKFTQLYKEALEEIDLNSRIKQMLNKVSK